MGPIETSTALPADYDALVARTPGIDRFCSRHEWSLSWHEVYGADRRLRVWRRGDSLVVLTESPTTSLMLPLEAMWGYCCPLVGPAAIELFHDVLQDADDLRGPILLLGLPDDDAWVDRLEQGLPAGWWTDVPVDFESTLRPVASLQGGVEGFLARRSPHLRRSLRRSGRRAAALGVTFERHRGGDEDAFEGRWARILDVERRSWKGRTGQGADEGDFAEFYRVMIRRLLRTGDFRLVLARLDGRDIGYLHGAVLGDTFRGFQFSFDDDYRYVAPGNLLQLQLIDWVAGDGVVRYDFGWDAEYKARWTDPGPLVTRNLMVMGDELRA